MVRDRLTNAKPSNKPASTILKLILDRDTVGCQKEVNLGPKLDDVVLGTIEFRQP